MKLKENIFQAVWVQQLLCSPLGPCCPCQLSWGRAGLPILLTSAVLASRYSALPAALLSRHHTLMNSKQEFRKITPEIPADSRKLLIAVLLMCISGFCLLSPAVLYGNALSPWVLLGAGAQIQQSVINLSFQDMFLLEREQQMLIFFWSSSSELLAIRGRFLLAGTTRTLALSPRRKVAEQRRLLMSSALWLLAKGGILECPVLLAPLAGLLGTQGIPRVPSYPSSHTQVPQPPSLLLFASFCSFF